MPTKEAPGSLGSSTTTVGCCRAATARTPAAPSAMEKTRKPSATAARTAPACGPAPVSGVEAGSSSRPMPAWSPTWATPSRKRIAAGSVNAYDRRSASSTPTAPARPDRSVRAAGSGPQ
jgi:hypothetical protein